MLSAILSSLAPMQLILQQAAQIQIAFAQPTQPTTNKGEMAMQRKTLAWVAVGLIAVAVVLWAWRLLGSRQPPPPPSPEAKTMRPPLTSKFVVP